MMSEGVVSRRVVLREGYGIVGHEARATRAGLISLMVHLLHWVEDFAIASFG